MMSYVYAITDRPEEPLPGQLGLGDAELAQVAWRGISAVISAHGGARPSASADELWRHEEVVEALMSRRAVLPARFGMVLPSEHQVTVLLCRAYGQFLDDIERVRDHVEIGLRFMATAVPQPEAGLLLARDTAAGASGLPGDGPPPPVSLDGINGSGAAPGTAYLRARVARQRTLRNRREVQLETVREVFADLASHAAASRLDVEPADRLGVSAAFLLRRDRFGLFRLIVGRIADARPELALLCTGPWPPYSFVSANAVGLAASMGGSGHAH